MRAKFLMTVGFIVLICSFSMAQIYPNGFGLAQLKGECGVAQSNSFSLYNNPSTLLMDSIQIGLSARNYFLFDELYQFSTASQFPLSFGTMGIGAVYYGDEFMNETTASIGFGKQIAENIFAGLSIHYISMFAQEADRETTISPQLGLTFVPSDKLSIGMTTRNPLSQDLQHPFQHNLQSFYALGFQYSPSSKVSTSLQTNLWEKDGFSSGLGLTVTPLPRLQIFLGANTQPGFVTAGLSIHLNKVNVAVGGKHQRDLGTSPIFIAETVF